MITKLKNVICKQVAEALKLEFYFSNAVTQEFRLTGFVDANGRYQDTQFFHAFTEGGIFFLDEMDASIPEVLVILNAAIANRYFDFPGHGRVQAHENFRVIAAGC
jgi:MoxR-like ATPase